MSVVGQRSGDHTWAILRPINAEVKVSSGTGAGAPNHSPAHHTATTSSSTFYFLSPSNPPKRRSIIKLASKYVYGREYQLRRDQ